MIATSPNDGKSDETRPLSDCLIKFAQGYEPLDDILPQLAEAVRKLKSPPDTPGDMPTAQILSRDILNRELDEALPTCARNVSSFLRLLVERFPDLQGVDVDLGNTAEDYELLRADVGTHPDIYHGAWRSARRFDKVAQTSSVAIYRTMV